MLSAQFIADFSSFTAACENAKTELFSFETGAGKVETSLKNMERGFSGIKMVQDAQLAAQAVENIGGVSKLTEKELARLGAQATEAVAKMHAMGVTVPPGVQKIADEAKKTESAFGLLGEKAREIGLMIAGAFTVRALASFVSGSLEAAHNLEILSYQTQIGTTDLQILAAATAEFGIEGEQLARGIYQLSRRIAGGDESASTALHMMGMSLEDVRGKNGQELFLIIEHGLAKLQGSLRDTASADLFGARIGSAMAAASTGIDEAMARARALNTIMSPEAVKAAGDYEHSIDRAKLSLSAMAVEMVGPVAQGFNVLMESVQKGTSKWALFWAGAQDMSAAIRGSAVEQGHLTELLDQGARAAAKAAEATTTATAAHGASAKALDAEGQAAQFMAALQVDALKTVTPSQQHYLEQLKEMGELNAKNAAAIGVGASQFKNYQASIEAAKKAADEFTKAQEEARLITASWNTLLAEIEKTTHHLAITWEKEMTEASNKVAAAVNGSIVSQLKTLTDYQQKNELALLSGTALKLRQLAIEQAAVMAANQTENGANAQLYALMAAEVETYFARQRALVTEGESVFVSSLARQTVAVEAAALSWSQAMSQVAAGMGTMSGSVQGYPSSRAVVQAAWNAGTYYGPVLGGTAQNPHGTGPDWTALGLKTGGSAQAGMPYVVGEQGPELFVPSQSGTVIPNHQTMGTTITNHIYITQPLGTPDAIARAVGNALTSRMRATGLRFPSGS